MNMNNKFKPHISSLLHTAPIQSYSQSKTSIYCSKFRIAPAAPTFETNDTFVVTYEKDFIQFFLLINALIGNEEQK